LYDAAGNMTYDGAHHYFYDAENRLSAVDYTGDCSTSTACYFYNAAGQRISKYSQGGSLTTFYLYDTNGEVLADTDGNQNWDQTYIHFGGQLVAQYRGTATGFLIKDHLGSTRLDTLYPYSGPSSVYDNMDYLPFGEQIAGGSATTHKFTGKERDSESGLDNFGARFDATSLGRFVSPDPAGGMRLVPQSLNLYAYVLNNPMRFIDPLGLWHCDWGNGESDDTEANGGASKADCKDQGGASWVIDDGDSEGISAGEISYCLNDCFPELQNSSLGNQGAGTDSLNPLSAEDDPIRALFTNNPRCPNCGHILNGTSQAINIATAYSVAVPTAGIGAVTVGPTALAYATGWSYAAYGSASGFVLGLYPAYLEAAEEGGFGAYNIPVRLYNFLQATGDAWTANQAYIDAQVFLGRQMYLAGPAVVSGTTTLSLELQRMKELGIQPQDWILLRVPY
jgi:RHS repeat-associated protein